MSRGDWTPDHSEGLDATLRLIWAKLPPTPQWFMLAGGTAIALYCGHRQSFDLNWVALPPLHVSERMVAELPMFAQNPDLTLSKVSGGDGLVDCQLDVPHGDRSIHITFMEPLPRVFPMPEHEPIVANNGVTVMHPIDTLAGKLMALISREILRDYQDVAWFAQHAPDVLEAAMRQLDRQRQMSFDRCLRFVVSPPPNVVGELTTIGELAALHSFAKVLDDT